MNWGHVIIAISLPLLIIAIWGAWCYWCTEQLWRDARAEMDDGESRL